MNPRSPSTDPPRPARWTTWLRPGWRGALLGLACALVSWWLTTFAFVRGVEDWMLDACFFWRGQRPTSANVVLVELDEPSLDDLKKPLAFLSPDLARVVRFLKDKGAAVIALDVMVPESLGELVAIRCEDGEGYAGAMGLAVAPAGNVVLPQRKSERRWPRALTGSWVRIGIEGTN